METENPQPDFSSGEDLEFTAGLHLPQGRIPRFPNQKNDLNIK
jgi:hypothetical protein